MDTDVDLLTPIDGIAQLICRGFTMRQIASLYALRARVAGMSGVRCPGRTARQVSFLGRCSGAWAERRRWRTF
jgi:hypothetical protein